MKRDIAKRVIAGIFFIISLLIIAGFIFIIGVEKGFTEPKFQMTALFKQVGGLAVGAPVRVSGVTVGTVSDISFLEDEVQGRGVKVVLSLYQKYRDQLRKSRKIAIITEGILGEKIVEITTTPDFRREDLSQPVIGEDPLDVQTLAENLGSASLALMETAKSIDAVITEVQSISASVKRLLNRIEQRVIEGNLFKVF